MRVKNMDNTDFLKCVFDSMRDSIWNWTNLEFSHTGTHKMTKCELDAFRVTSRNK